MYLRIVMLIILLFPVCAEASTYTWYFSDDAAGNAAGNDTTGNGTIGSPWKSLSKAQDMLDTLTNSDTATLYFDRGDTWSITQGYRSNYGTRITLESYPSGWTDRFDAVLWHDAGTVTLDAYGTGDRPIFDGGETWGETYPRAFSGRDLTDAVILMKDRGECTIRNLEIRNFFADLIRLYGAVDNVLIEDNKLTYAGTAGIRDGGITSAKHNITVQNNEVGYTALLYFKYSNPSSDWCGAIHFIGGGESGAGAGVYDVVIKDNTVYRAGGEGIVACSFEGSTVLIEGNIVSDTGHISVFSPTMQLDGGVSIIRNNIIYWTAEGRNLGYDSAGLYVYDEVCDSGSCDQNAPGDTYGDNSTAYHLIYNNLIVGGSYGIWIMPSEDPWGYIGIFNNTFIDNTYSVRIGYNPSGSDVDIFDNTFIKYDLTGSHIYNPGSYAMTGWTWGPNHWYGGTLPGSPYYVP